MPGYMKNMPFMNMPNVKKDKAVLDYLGKKKFNTRPDKKIIRNMPMVKAPLWSLIKGK